MIKRIIPLILKQQENKLNCNIRLFCSITNEKNTIEDDKKLLLLRKKKQQEQKNYKKFLNETDELDSIIKNNKNKEINNTNINKPININSNIDTNTVLQKKQQQQQQKEEVDIKILDYTNKKEIAPGIFINPKLTEADRNNVVITCAKDREEEAKEISKQLNLDFLPLDQVLKLPDEIFQYKSVLFVQDRGVSLHDFEPSTSNKQRGIRKMTNEIFLDYTKGAVAFRTEFGKNKRSPMIRSICTTASGFNLPSTVLDVTGGLGKDAWVMASMGANVTIIERNPVLVYMINRALQQASINPETTEIASRVTLIHMDSIQYIVENINTMPLNERPVVIYMDPMYPSKQKEKALSKKDIRAVRKLVGGDRDSTILFALSRRFATNRVVWKRPRHVVPFIGSNIEYKSSDTRYYVYLSKDVKEKDNIKINTDDVDE